MNAEDVSNIKEIIKNNNSKLASGKYDSLIIRDIIEQVVLKELYSIDEFKERFAFKGGTALSKCLLDYHRFSVDLDFTYALAYTEIEEAYASTNQKKKEYDKMRRLVGNILAQTAENLRDIGIDFVYDPSDKKWIHIKYNKKIVSYTFHITHPELMDEHLKIEMNITEKLYFKPIKMVAKTYMGISYMSYKPVEVLVYAPEELLVEKYKAMLSRVVWRDYYDAYFLFKKLNILPFQVQDIIFKKLQPLFELSQIKKRTLYTIERYIGGDVTPELLKEHISQNGVTLILRILPEDFDDFARKVIYQLSYIGENIKQNIEEIDGGDYEMD